MKYLLPMSRVTLGFRSTYLPLLILALAYISIAGIINAGIAQAPVARASAPLCPPTWNVVSSPNIGTSSNSLQDVALVSANEVWSVGAYNTTTTTRTLIQRWDGAQWNIVPSPNIGDDANILSGVDTLSSTDAWAVGYYTSVKGPDLAMSMHWDGTQWSIVPVPIPVPLVSTTLRKVTALAADDVWAVGYGSEISPTNRIVTFITHWDGIAWSAVLSPNPGVDRNELWGISAIAPDDIWAVGLFQTYQSGVDAETLTLHWDGAEWIQVSAPQFPNNELLYGVSGISSDDVWAVGYYHIDTDQAFMIHWDGTEWTQIAGPDIGISYLYDVETLSSNDVWAVGTVQGSSLGESLALHWDGTQWSRVPSPNPGANINYLKALAALSLDDVWAVGFLADCVFCPFKTLTEHYYDACSTPSPTVTGTPPTATSTFTRTPTRTRTATVTGTPPTRTPTRTYTPSVTRTNTRTPIPTSTLGPPPQCDPTTNYAVSVTSGATIVPADFDIGNHCNDCMTAIQLPFPFHLYDQTFTEANVSSNGNIQFASNDPFAGHSCLPYAPFSYAILPLWRELYTDVLTNPLSGIYTSVSGIAPNRIFNILWITAINQGGSLVAQFELRLYENSPEQRFDIIYGITMGPVELSAVGMQRGPGDLYTQYQCDTGGTIDDGLQLTFALAACPIATPTAIVTATTTGTAVPSTTASPTACAITFTDVPPDHTFYANIRCLACRGIISGYTTGCETGSPCFKPGNLVTRGQLSKIVANSAGFVEPAGAQQFEDVPVGSTFYEFVWRLADREYISGYPCGGPGEPCGNANLPYFRPNSNITRGQISKIVANAAGFIEPAGMQQFEDVPPGHTFYDYIWRLADREIMSGYACGGVGEPCVPPNDLPYFRPAANATRGQVSKIVANTFFPGCETP